MRMPKIILIAFIALLTLATIGSIFGYRSAMWMLGRMRPRMNPGYVSVNIRGIAHCEQLQPGKLAEKWLLDFRPWSEICFRHSDMVQEVSWLPPPAR